MGAPSARTILKRVVGVLQSWSVTANVHRCADDRLAHTQARNDNGRIVGEIGCYYVRPWMRSPTTTRKCAVDFHALKAVAPLGRL